ncbi:MAG: hypothetical protein U0V18_09880 [Anaerolineales bacterium]
MADTRVQLEVEDWVRREWLPSKFEQVFRRERLRLNSGGVFDFDAVSSDNTIVANISTSSGITSGGKNPSGKIQKLRADMLFLLMVETDSRLIVLTEKSMYDLCLKEKSNGRVPHGIEFVLVELPEALSKSLHDAKSIASKEVAPRNYEG